MMLPVQSQGVARSETAITTRDLNQILQPNAEQSARVVNSRQDPVSPTLFRVALEVGNQRLEVMTNRPLAEGLTVLLSRDARGDVDERRGRGTLVDQTEHPPQRHVPTSEHHNRAAAEECLAAKGARVGARVLVDLEL